MNRQNRDSVKKATRKKSIMLIRINEDHKLTTGGLPSFSWAISLVIEKRRFIRWPNFYIFFLLFLQSVTPNTHSSIFRFQKAASISFAYQKILINSYFVGSCELRIVNRNLCIIHVANVSNLT